MTTLVRTLNSLYEIDKENNQIRRLNGINNPTPRQGNDGEYRKYDCIADMLVGNSMVVIWQDGTKYTMTSVIQEII